MSIEAKKTAKGANKKEFLIVTPARLHEQHFKQYELQTELAENGLNAVALLETTKILRKRHLKDEMP